MTAALLLLTACGSPSDEEKTDSGDRESVDLDVTPAMGIGREEEMLESESENIVDDSPAKDNGYVICIDPGHGFLDGGCGYGYLPDGLCEKDVTLAISKKLNEELKALGYKTIMTHDGMSFPHTAIDDGNNKFNPNERVSFANSLSLDYYVSIHVNSYDKDLTVSGARIYYQDTTKKINESSGVVANHMASAIEDEMNEEPTPVVISMDIKSSFAVIRDTVAPASLVEVGFATNEGDAAKMVTDEWQSSMAKALAHGIDRHFTGTGIEA